MYTTDTDQDYSDAISEKAAELVNGHLKVHHYGHLKVHHFKSGF